MKILSRFKDYYDHVAHIYGGGDPRTTYVRDRLSQITPVKSVSVRLDYATESVFRSARHQRIHVAVLSVAARKYLLIGESPEAGCYDTFRIVDSNNKDKVGKLFSQHFYFGRKSSIVDDFMGKYDEDLATLSKVLRAPVFIVLNCHSNPDFVEVLSDIPKLSDIGLPAICQAEQLYQDLAYFVGNTMRDSPDVLPPAQVDNAVKIEQHGFDLKTSFRHRNLS